jgi:hypothetical protein
LGNKVTVTDLPAPFTAYNVTATVTAAPTTTTFEYVEGAATVASAATTVNLLIPPYLLHTIHIRRQTGLGLLSQKVPTLSM